jgi:hypothetical protein
MRLNRRWPPGTAVVALRGCIVGGQPAAPREAVARRLSWAPWGKPPPPVRQGRHRLDQLRSATPRRFPHQTTSLGTARTRAMAASASAGLWQYKFPISVHPCFRFDL